MGYLLVQTHTIQDSQFSQATSAWSLSPFSLPIICAQYPKDSMVQNSWDTQNRSMRTDLPARMKQSAAW